MELYEDTVQYSRSNASTNQLGDIFIQVTTTGIAAPKIELSNVNDTIRWKPITQAKRDLLQTFALSKIPEIVIHPAWMNRMPWLTWRTSITVNSPSYTTN